MTRAPQRSERRSVGREIHRAPTPTIAIAIVISFLKLNTGAAAASTPCAK